MLQAHRNHEILTRDRSYVCHVYICIGCLCVCKVCNMHGCEIGTKSIRYKIVPIFFFFLNNTAQLHIHGEDETSRTSGPSSYKMELPLYYRDKNLSQCQIQSRRIRSRTGREKRAGRSSLLIYYCHRDSCNREDVEHLIREERSIDFSSFLLLLLLSPSRGRGGFTKFERTGGQTLYFRIALCCV